MDMQKVAELRKKANTLPMEPGVYLMRDRRGGSVMTIFEIDQPVPESVRERLAQVPCVVSVIYSEKEGD